MYTKKFENNCHTFHWKLKINSNTKDLTTHSISAFDPWSKSILVTLSMRTVLMLTDSGSVRVKDDGERMTGALSLISTMVMFSMA